MSEVVSTPPVAKRSYAGRWLVASMFLLGFTATGLLRWYWNEHLEPFMPLQEAIEKDFPGSAPRVDGGKRRLDRDTPMILRVVIKVPFDPTQTEPTPIVESPPPGVKPSGNPPVLVKAPDEMMRYADRIRELAKTHVSSPKADVLEIHYYHLIKEKEIREGMVRRDMETWEVVKDLK
ncbi:MAG: hypothetical protein JNL58_06605 [Planctomyces sp.]|nr:hypothetical protein [Planctomyces sp.]